MLVSLLPLAPLDATDNVDRMIFHMHLYFYGPINQSPMTGMRLGDGDMFHHCAPGKLIMSYQKILLQKKLELLLAVVLS